MTFVTTTAGTISAGPFIEKLDALHRTLERELTGEAPTFEDDRRLCLCLEPDEWERDEQVVLTKKSIRRKVNPMLGRIVQHSSYDSWIAEATGDSTKLPELMAKYFNVYQTGRVIKWLSGDQIRPRQTERRISDCWATQGWRVFCGLDFGGTDDLWAACYLAVNYQTQQPEGRFFADLDLWITEKAMTESPNRPLYEMWVRDGWMHICPGEVFSHEMAVNKIMYRAGYDEHGKLIVSPDKQIDITMFGYDPAQSIQPINQLKAWLQSLGIDALTIKKMVIPVSQSFVTMNGLVQEIEYALLTDQPWMQLSMNPSWPWMFQNVKLEVSPNELKKPLKSGVNNKVDGIHALLDALYCFDFSEGMIQT
jgi:phage terminase large subunit-like protein